MRNNTYQKILLLTIEGNIGWLNQEKEKRKECKLKKKRKKKTQENHTIKTQNNIVATAVQTGFCRKKCQVLFL